MEPGTQETCGADMSIRYEQRRSPGYWYIVATLFLVLALFFVGNLIHTSLNRPKKEVPFTYNEQILKELQEIKEQQALTAAALIGLNRNLNNLGIYYKVTPKDDK